MTEEDAKKDLEYLNKMFERDERDEGKKLNFDYVNSIDLPKPLYHEEVCEYMERADWFADKGKFPKELKGELFRFLDEEEVSGYLMMRFNVLVLNGRVV